MKRPTDKKIEQKTKKISAKSKNAEDVVDKAFLNIIKHYQLNKTDKVNEAQ